MLIVTAEEIQKGQPQGRDHPDSACQECYRLARRKSWTSLRTGRDRSDRHGFFHPYYPNPQLNRHDRHILALDSLMKSYSPKIKLFQGETGYPSILEYGHAMNHYGEWSEYKQAKWDLRRMANDFNLEIMPTYSLWWISSTTICSSRSVLIRMNLLKKVVYLRPSYYAVQNMASLLTTKVFPFELEVSTTARGRFQSWESRMIPARRWERCSGTATRCLRTCLRRTM